MMRYGFRCIIALCVAIAPGISSAMGLGEISMVSRIGERLLAEVAIFAPANEKPEADCFSLIPNKNAELPVVTAAQHRMIRRGQQFFLQIVGNRPISEPIFTIALRVACGYELEREYVLMPEAPMQLAETSAPGDLEERQRPLAGLGGTNLDIDPKAKLTKVTPTQLLAHKRRKIQQKLPTPAAQANSAEPPTAKKFSRTSGKLPLSSINDRLILGISGEEIEKPALKGRADSALTRETEERLLKLEATLYLLHQEVEKMDEALALASKLIEAQNKLQQANTLQLLPPSEAIAVTTNEVPTDSPAKSGWLELILSALIGAGISIWIARLLGQRKLSPDKAPDPPPVSQPVEPEPVPPSHIASPALPALAASPVFSISEIALPAISNAECIELCEEDDRSILDLTEVMLAFGRIRDATDTLSEYVEQNLPATFLPWRVLLDLYRRGGDQAAFESLATKVRARFNVNIPVWAQLTQPISELKSLEDFPHVIEKIDQIWGSQTCFDYLQMLTHDNRDGKRSGFPLEVVEEIALLMQILETAHRQEIC